MRVIHFRSPACSLIATLPPTTTRTRTRTRTRGTGTGRSRSTTIGRSRRRTARLRTTRSRCRRAIGIHRRGCVGRDWIACQRVGHRGIGAGHNGWPQRRGKPRGLVRSDAADVWDVNAGRDHQIAVDVHRAFDTERNLQPRHLEAAAHVVELFLCHRFPAGHAAARGSHRVGVAALARGHGSLRRGRRGIGRPRLRRHAGLCRAGVRQAGAQHHRRGRRGSAAWHRRGRQGSLQHDAFLKNLRRHGGA